MAESEVSRRYCTHVQPHCQRLDRIASNGLLHCALVSAFHRHTPRVTRGIRPVSRTAAATFVHFSLNGAQIHEAIAWRALLQCCPGSTLSAAARSSVVHDCDCTGLGGCAQAYSTRSSHGGLMRTMGLQTVDGRWVARQVRMVAAPLSRPIGLFSRQPLAAQQGLLISPGGSVCTVGTCSAVDIVFLSRQLCVVGLAPEVLPWRYRRAPAGTGRVLQLAAGRIAAADLALGMFLVVESEPEDGPDALARGPRCADAAPRSSCHRLPIQFSLRVSMERRHAPPRMSCRRLPARHLS
jgi:uncharacterized protein